MAIMDSIRTAVQNFLQLDDIFNQAKIQRLEDYQLLYNYYQGDQRRQMRVRSGQADDNIAINFAGLVVERSISLMLGSGIDFDLPGEPEDAEQQFINEIWDANKKNIFLHRAAQYAGIFGTGYIKLMPEYYEGLPRLVCLDPRWMEIKTLPEDIEEVYMYEMRYNYLDERGNKVGRKEETIRQVNDAGEAIGWEISNYILAPPSSKWELMWEPQVWEYDFAPILHWQNLPEPADCYGQSDIADVVELQDRINFIASNISKIIRYHAHPKTWGRGGGIDKEVNWGADKMVMLGGEGMLQNLEMQSDLTSSQAYMLALRQALFDISRTVDITSMADKLGALTNFGLRVLFMDALAKLGSKRELFGDALIELNRRMLVLNGQTDPDPGEIVWPDVVPNDEREEVEAMKFDLEHNLLSKQTASGIRGYNYEEEQERMEEEKAGEENIGSLILKAFEGGG